MLRRFENQVLISESGIWASNGVAMMEIAGWEEVQIQAVRRGMGARLSLIVE